MSRRGVEPSTLVHALPAELPGQCYLFYLKLLNHVNTRHWSYFSHLGYSKDKRTARKSIIIREKFRKRRAIYIKNYGNLGKTDAKPQRPQLFLRFDGPSSSAPLSLLRFVSVLVSCKLLSSSETTSQGTHSRPSSVLITGTQVFGIS